jgi:hypothetical protein
MKVLSPPRLAFEGACVFVEAAQCDAYWWLSDVVRKQLGPMYALKLAETRLRLAREEDAEMAEGGAWRARLEELLIQRPDLIPLLTRMVDGSAKDAVRQARLKATKKPRFTD